MKVFYRFGWKGSLKQLVNNKGVCRTTPVTPECFFKSDYHQVCMIYYSCDNGYHDEGHKKVDIFAIFNSWS